MLHFGWNFEQAVDFTLYRCMPAEKGSAACSSASTTCSIPTRALLLGHVARAGMI